MCVLYKEALPNHCLVVGALFQIFWWTNIWGWALQSADKGMACFHHMFDYLCVCVIIRCGDDSLFWLRSSWLLNTSMAGGHWWSGCWFLPGMQSRCIMQWDSVARLQCLDMVLVQIVLLTAPFFPLLFPFFTILIFLLQLCSSPLFSPSYLICQRQIYIFNFWHMYTRRNRNIVSLNTYGIR